MQYLNIMQKIRTAVSGLNGPFEQYPRSRERRFYPGTQSIYLLGGFHRSKGGRFEVRGYPAHPYGLSGRVTTFSPLLVEESAPSDFELVALGRGALTTTSVSGTS